MIRVYIRPQYRATLNIAVALSRGLVIDSLSNKHGVLDVKKNLVLIFVFDKVMES